LAASKTNPRDDRAIATAAIQGRAITVRLAAYELHHDDSGEWVQYQPDEGRTKPFQRLTETPRAQWVLPSTPVVEPTRVHGWYCPAYFFVDGFDVDVRVRVDNVGGKMPPQLEITEVVMAGRNGKQITSEQQRLPLGKLTELLRTAARIVGVLPPAGYDGPGKGIVNGDLVELRDAKGNPRRAFTATAEQLQRMGVTLQPALWGRAAVEARDLRRTRTSKPRMAERDLRAAELADRPAAKGRQLDYVRTQLLAEGYTIGGLENTKKAIQRGRKLQAERSTKNTKKKGGKK
jgi:hypothetical protein